MAEWWNQATDWLGDTFKPKGYTGALMDAGYLDWSDVLGAASRGLLDYGAQERARSAWRPINAPEPIVDPGRSFDLYNASIGNRRRKFRLLRRRKFRLFRLSHLMQIVLFNFIAGLVKLVL